jgi:hypothetical protein
MTLHSALEDVQRTTMKAVAGGLSKLEYLAGLRGQDGSYEHWGLARVYGGQAAKRALGQAHRSLLSKILATPIRKLVEEVEQSSDVAGLPPATYVDHLAASSQNLLPPGPGAGSARHLSSVLHALSSLLKHPKLDANPPTGSQSPQPGR